MLKKPRKKILVIVAHPDDETIWMGGTLIRNKKKWNTKVVSLTRKSDKDRFPKFKKVTKALGTKGYIYDLNDTLPKERLDPEKIFNILSKHKGEYDKIFTHNSNGEYGHLRHKDVHKAVVQAIKEGILNPREVFFFSYLKRKNRFQGYATYNSNADILIKLNRDELSMKRKLAIDVYGYNRGGKGFEELSAGRVESFNRYKK